MKAIPFLILLIVCSPLLAQGPTFNDASRGARPLPHTPPPIVRAPASVAPTDDKLRIDLVRATERLSAVEAAVAKAADRADQVALRTSWFSLGTVLGTAFLTAALSLLAQWLLMRHQRKLNAQDAGAQVANAYVEWQLKQLSELYGPLRALLGQSNEIYRQMNRALIAKESTRFRLIEGDDFDKQEFQIRIDQDWTRFRTVQHLNEVYNKQFGVEPYFDDVIQVGKRMATLISNKAGYARSEDSELISEMGKYLGHYNVLKRMHKIAKTSVQVAINAADRDATFPNKIQHLVNEGFTAINGQVMDWRKAIAEND